MNLSLHVDGASRGNPGPASVGVVIKDTDTGKVIHEAGYPLGQLTNNSAEYRGLVRGLALLLALKGIEIGRVSIHSDSQLMVRQITGEYRMKSADLMPLLEEAQMKLLGLTDWTIQHVPREKNARADKLANMALDEGKAVVLVAGPGTGEVASEPIATVNDEPAAPAKGKGKSSEPSVNLADLPKYSGLRWSARLRQSPGPMCPAKCPAKTAFIFGPGLPHGFCIHAAQAVYDENPTLWKEAGVQTCQTDCPKCDVTIEVERLG
ncbi:MAG: ribonuclease HI family protein [Phycisphaeraceae bacterium]